MLQIQELCSVHALENEPKNQFQQKLARTIHELFIFFQIQVSLKEQINSFTGKYSKELQHRKKTEKNSPRNGGCFFNWGKNADIRFR